MSAGLYTAFYCDSLIEYCVPDRYPLTRVFIYDDDALVSCEYILANCSRYITKIKETIGRK